MRSFTHTKTVNGRFLVFLFSLLFTVDCCVSCASASVYSCARVSVYTVCVHVRVYIQRGMCKHCSALYSLFTSALMILQLNCALTVRLPKYFYFVVIVSHHAQCLFLRCCCCIDDLNFWVLHLISHFSFSLI